jgi:hypothetical protein
MRIDAVLLDRSKRYMAWLANLPAFARHSDVKHVKSV